MAMRPLEKLPSIRAKLGSVIVLGGRHDAADQLRGHRVRLARLAARQRGDRRAAAREPGRERRAASSIPSDTAIVTRSPDGSVTIEGRVLLRAILRPFSDGVPHWGVVGHITYASVPTTDGGWVTAMQPSPSRGSLGRMSATLGFLQSMWWQFLLAGAIAGVISLLIARWLARGMTQPLRDMAAAARAMEMGDYTVRVVTHQQGRGRPARRGVQPDERGAGGVGEVSPRSRRQRLPRAQDPDHRDPRAPGEPRRRRRAAGPQDAAGDAGPDRTARAARRPAAGPVATGERRGADVPGGRRRWSRSSLGCCRRSRSVAR